MQAKKRAKSVKFGSKAQPPKSAEHHKPAVTHHPKPEPEKETKKPTHEAAVEIPAEKPEELPSEGLNTVQPEPEIQAAESDTEPQEIKSSGPTTRIPEPPPAAIEPDEPPLSAPQTAPEPQDQPPQESQEKTQILDESTYPPLGGDTYVVEKEIKKNMLGFFIMIAVIAFLIGIAVMAGATYFSKGIKLPDNIPYLTSLITTPTPTPKPTLTPTPTEKKINLAAYSIEIRNGSGVTGAAATLKSTLTTDGFKVIDTGNADSNDYEKTIIQSGKNIDPDFLTKLNQNLKEEYALASNGKIPSSYTGNADIIIIIGKEKNN